MVLVEGGPELEIGEGSPLHLGNDLLFLVFYPQFTHQIQELHVGFLAHFDMDLLLEHVVLIVLLPIKRFELHLQEGLQGCLLFSSFVEEDRVL